MTWMKLEEARNFEIPNGTAVDLAALADSRDTMDGLKSPESVKDLAVGQIAYVFSYGGLKRGVVTKIGRIKATITFVTRTGVENARAGTGWGKGGMVKVTAKSESVTGIAVAYHTTMPDPATAPARTRADEPKTRYSLADALDAVGMTPDPAPAPSLADRAESNIESADRLIEETGEMIEDLINRHSTIPTPPAGDPAECVSARGLSTTPDPETGRIPALEGDPAPVADPRDDYFTKGCGADVVKRDRELIPGRRVDLEDITFPEPICPLTEPHGKHIIPGTWRTQCQGIPEGAPGQDVPPAGYVHLGSVGAGKSRTPVHVAAMGIPAPTPAELVELALTLAGQDVTPEVATPANHVLIDPDGNVVREGDSLPGHNFGPGVFRGITRVPGDGTSTGGKIVADWQHWTGKEGYPPPGYRIVPAASVTPKPVMNMWTEPFVGNTRQTRSVVGLPDGRVKAVRVAPAMGEPTVTLVTPPITLAAPRVTIRTGDVLIVDDRHYRVADPVMGNDVPTLVPVDPHAPAAGDVVAFRCGSPPSGRPYEVIEVDFGPQGPDTLIRLSPLDPKDTRDPFWVSARMVKRVAIGTGVAYDEDMTNTANSLSVEARAALTNVGTSRQGAAIPERAENAVRAELLDAGLIGTGLGLTQKGSIVRDIIARQDEDRLFPL